MTAPLPISDSHCRNDVLIQLLDDELPAADASKAEAHLALCSHCRDRFVELRRASAGFDSFVESLGVLYAPSERETLAGKLEAAEAKQLTVTVRRPGRRLSWWGIPVAAALTFGILYSPSSTKLPAGSDASRAGSETAGAFEIDGETFVALPFSNPELPLSSPRIVQMQVPLSSLADAGVVFEPISSRVSAPDRSVLADVLLGLDGQPLAVHVLSFD